MNDVVIDTLSSNIIMETDTLAPLFPRHLQARHDCLSLEMAAVSQALPNSPSGVVIPFFVAVRHFFWLSKLLDRLPEVDFTKNDRQAQNARASVKLVDAQPIGVCFLVPNIDCNIWSIQQHLARSGHEERYLLLGPPTV